LVVEDQRKSETYLSALEGRNEVGMPDEDVTLTMAKADAEVLLGVLSSERYNAETEAVCDSIRKQLDEKLAEPSQGS
jgi:hypothetical protein